MIITLKNANFSASNIGTLSTWRITRSLGAGATYEGPISVDKGASFSATVTIAEGYDVEADEVAVTMGDIVISAATIDNNIIAIVIPEVTGNVVIKVPTAKVSNSPVQLTGISAEYPGGNIASNASIDDLKENLIVYANYSDGTSTIIDTNAVTLSGTIGEGQNTITVTFGEYSTTLTIIGVVVLTQLIAMYDGTALDVGSTVDTLAGLGVMAVWSNGTTELVSDYTLSSNGQIVEGDNAINITYGNLTTTIHVNGVSAVDPNAVDLVLFTGQSNMSGRGTAADAPIVPEGQGYWYKDDGLTNMSKDIDGLYQITEPFGLESLCTGSMVSQFAASYYKQTRCPIVACAGAIGGTDLELFTKGNGQIYGNYIAKSVNGAKNYLASIGKTIRRAFVVFNQGENDAQHNRSTEAYISTFNQFWSDLKADFGFEEMFIIGIGQYNGSSDIDFANVKAAHLALAANNSDITFVSDKFTGATAYMRDEWHYTQVVYNAVGKDAATNIVNYYNGVTPTITQFTGLDTSTEPILTVGNIDGWDYEIIGGTVKLKQYTGSNPDVFVHAYYAIDGQIYRTLVAKVETKTTSGTSMPVDGTQAVFAKNTSITSVEFEDNVDLEGNNASCLFYGCTALKTVSNIPNAAGGSASLCYGCTSLTSYPTFTKYSGTLNQAFRNCSNLVADATTIIFPADAIKFGNMFRDCKKITSAPNIPETAQEITAMFQGCTGLVTAGDVTLAKGTLATSVFYGCTNLKSVGKVYGDTITSIASLFQNCKALEGTIRIECPNITTATNAFSSVDLTKVTIEVPANSTTYTTITSAYPAATVVQF